jgi:hypothetical protein
VRQHAGHAHPVAARQRDLRDAHQPAVRHRHPEQARGDAGADRQDRHPGAPGADRGAHRRGRRHLRPRWASSSAAPTCAACAAGIPGYNIGGSNYVTVGGNYNAVGGQTGQTGPTTSTTTRSSSTCRPTWPTRFSGANAATFALSLFSATANRFLNLELSALEAEGKGKIVSSPRVITADQTKASIEQGEEIPYQAGHLQRRHVDPVPQGQPALR